MFQRKPGITQAMMVSATAVAHCKINRVKKLASVLNEDRSKSDRVEQALCMACYYLPGREEVNPTTNSCMSCVDTPSSGVALVNVLCLSCAKRYDLCKKCGGDSEMREGRGDWPVINGRDQ